MEGQRHTRERGWKGEKHYNKYNVIKPACMVEDAVMCIIQVHQLLVCRESVGGSGIWFSNSQATGTYVPATREPPALPKQTVMY